MKNIVYNPCYVSNITDDCLVGYRYLDFDGSEHNLSVKLKGKGKGEFRIFLSDEDDIPNTVLAAEVNSEV